MNCEDCGFKKEVRKLKKFDCEAIGHVCEICGNSESEDSLISELTRTQVRGIQALLKEYYIRCGDFQSISELTGLPLDVVRNILSGG